MRVVAREKFAAYRHDTCQVLEAAPGQEFTGYEATFLVDSRCPVNVVEADPQADPQSAVEETPASDGGEPTGEETPASGDAGFDPGDHSVSEVLAYLTEHPDDAELVIEAELDGKARKTILDRG